MSNGKLTEIEVSLYDINKAIEANDLKEQPLEEIVSKQYNELLRLFNIVSADRLPPHHPGIDNVLQLKNGEVPPWGHLDSMSRAEFVVLEEWLEENMAKWFIHPASSPFATLVVFASTPNGGLQLYIDSRDIYLQSMKNRYPLLLIQEPLNPLRGTQIYTMLDVGQSYILSNVKEGDEHKFRFQSRYSLFEPTVMQFGMTNAPVYFQGYINNTIREALDDVASTWLDNILILLS